eukprot:1194162-Prorocentrum_minimum.AAC.1
MLAGPRREEKGAKREEVGNLTRQRGKGDGSLWAGSVTPLTLRRHRIKPRPNEESDIITGGVPFFVSPSRVNATCVQKSARRRTALWVCSDQPFPASRSSCTACRYISTSSSWNSAGVLAPLACDERDINVTVSALFPLAGVRISSHDTSERHSPDAEVTRSLRFPAPVDDAGGGGGGGRAWTCTRRDVSVTRIRLGRDVNVTRVRLGRDSIVTRVRLGRDSIVTPSALGVTRL